MNKVIYSENSQCYYITRGVGCLVVSGAISTLAALFFTHIIPLHSSLASLCCGGVAACLNLFPLFYGSYLLYKRWTEPQNDEPINPDPNTQPTNGPNTETDDHQSINQVPCTSSLPIHHQLKEKDEIQLLESRIRTAVLVHEAEDVKKLLNEIHVKEDLRWILITPGYRSILSLATWDNDPRSSDIAIALINKAKELGILHEILFFDHNGYDASVFSTLNPSACLHIFDLVKDDLPLLQKLLMWKQPSDQKTLLHQVIAAETQQNKSQLPLTKAILNAAKQSNCLFSVVTALNAKGESIFANLGRFGTELMDLIMDSFENLDEIRAIVALTKDEDKASILIMEHNEVFSKHEWFFCAAEGLKLRMEKVLLPRLKMAGLDPLTYKNRQGLTALQIAQKHKQTAIIEYLQSL